MKKSDFDNLLLGVRQMKAIERGTLKPARVIKLDEMQVKAIRKNMGLSQGKFAKLLGVPIDTLQNWEQGRRKPDGPARALLTVAARRPKALLEALHG